MTSNEVTRFVPDFAIGLVGSSTSVVLGNLNLIAGITVALVSVVIMVLRYLDHRQKQALEMKKLEMDYRILFDIQKNTRGDDETTV